MSSSLFLQYHFYYIPFFSLCQISFFFWTHFQSSLYIGTALYSNVYRHILAFIVMIYYTIIEIHLTILSNQNQQTQTSSVFYFNVYLILSSEISPAVLANFESVGNKRNAEKFFLEDLRIVGTLWHSNGSKHICTLGWRAKEKHF